MKKILALILALVMVAALFAGCAKDEKNPADDSNTDGKSYKIIYVTPSTASDFWSQVETGIKQATKDYEEKLGIKSGECTPDGLFSIDSCRCVGACGLAPVMMVDDEVYGKMTVDQVDKILDKYIKKGGK